MAGHPGRVDGEESRRAAEVPYARDSRSYSGSSDGTSARILRQERMAALVAA
jgi:hypothetical protein